MEKNLYTQAEHNLILVNAKCICRDYPGLVGDPKELVYAGYMALLEAKTCYKTGKGAQFKTYASRCIHNAMLKELAHIRNVVNVPEKQSFCVNYMTINEDRPCNEAWEDTWEDTWEEDTWKDNAWERDLWEDDWEDNHYHQRVETLDRLLGQLDPSDRELVQCRYGIGRAPWTLKQLGEARGVSLQAVHKKLHGIEQGLHDSLCRMCA